MVNSIVSLVTLPNPIVTSGLEFGWLALADTWGEVSAITRKKINSTLGLNIQLPICLQPIKNRSYGNGLVTSMVTNPLPVQFNRKHIQ